MGFKFFKKRNVWLPTWPVILGLTLIIITSVSVILFSSHDFLAVTNKVPNAKILVVESWMADNSMEQVAEIFNDEKNNYESLWLIGPRLERGYYISEKYKTYNQMGAATLIELGIPREKIHLAPASKQLRHRTFSAAVNLKSEFEKNNIGSSPFDLVTLNVHARRSWITVKKVFGTKDQIGIIALPPVSYEAEKWMKTSAGVKSTIFESIAYLYELLTDSGR